MDMDPPHPPPLDVAALRADTPGLLPAWPTPGEGVARWAVAPRPPGAPDVAVTSAAALEGDQPGPPGGPASPHRLHLNAAGAALPPAPVLAAQLEWTLAEGRAGGYEVAACPLGAAAVEARPKAALARLLGCAPADLALVPSATHAWAQAFGGVAATLGPHDAILSLGSSEYGSNATQLLQAAARTGCALEVLPDDRATGGVDVAALAARLAAPPSPARPRVALVALTHAPTGGGHVLDAAAVGRACAEAPSRPGGVPFLLDACQSAGQVGLDVAALGVWWLSGTSRKWLRGPRGCGFLYASPRARAAFEPAALDVRGAAWAVAGGRETYTASPSAAAYEFYEASFAAKAGFGVALEYLQALGGPGPTGARAAGLAASARARLAHTPGVAVTDRAPHPPEVVLGGILTFTVAGLPAAAVVAALASGHGVRVHASGPASSARAFYAAGLIEGVVRASFHYYNDEEDVDRFVRAVAAVAAEVG